MVTNKSDQMSAFHWKKIILAMILAALAMITLLQWSDFVLDRQQIKRLPKAVIVPKDLQAKLGAKFSPPKHSKEKDRSNDDVDDNSDLWQRKLKSRERFKDRIRTLEEWCENNTFANIRYSGANHFIPLSNHFKLIIENSRIRTGTTQKNTTFYFH